MSRTNPRINAQINVLHELLGVNFDYESYDKDQFIDDRWKPSFHALQGVANMKKAIQEKIWELEAEEKRWQETLPNNNGSQSADSADVKPKSKEASE